MPANSNGAPPTIQLQVSPAVGMTQSHTQHLTNEADTRGTSDALTREDLVPAAHGLQQQPDKFPVQRRAPSAPYTLISRHATNLHHLLRTLSIASVRHGLLFQCTYQCPCCHNGLWPWLWLWLWLWTWFTPSWPRHRRIRLAESSSVHATRQGRLPWPCDRRS